MPFGFDGHKIANKLKGIKRSCFLELNKAMYWQDSIHQFQSKAHFDNCDFDNSLKYINELVAEVDVLLKSTDGFKEKDKHKHKRVLSAMFSLGQALHAVQDFFAHSNYIELMEKSHENLEDIPDLRLWGKEASDILKKIKGLHSGKVWWGIPKVCKGEVPSHHDLAKDDGNTLSGGKRITRWENISQYDLAKNLASHASFEFMKDSFNRWDVLKDVCGDTAIYSVFIDRRGL